MAAVNPEWVEAGARADVPAASYVCNPADGGHHWVSQLSQERIWVQTCSLCREMRLDLAEHDAAIRADERGRVHATIQAGEIPASLYEEMAYDLRAQIAADIEALPTTWTAAWDKGWDSVSLAEVLRIARGESGE